MKRWVWYGLLTLVALIAIAAELDRASSLRPELSVLVPGPFRSVAQPTIALLALATGDSATAQDETRRLVRRRPMPAEHLFTLAMAEMRNGRPEAFAAAFRAASTRGWRFAPLQTALAQTALAGGDVRGAANRIAALWAAEGSSPSVLTLTKELLAAPGGPEAFAVPLAKTHVWSASFLNRSLEVASPDHALQTVLAARRAGARFECADLRRFGAGLVERREVAPAQALVCS